MKKILLLGFMCLALTSCASIFGSTSENVSVVTNVEDAKITIWNRDYVSVWNSQSPTTVALDKKYGFFRGEKYIIRAEKEGFEPQERTLDTRMSGWYLGNIIFGGLIGMLIVDPATGAMWTFEDSRLFFNLEEKETQ